jgi:hypothetical protein
MENSLVSSNTTAPAPITLLPDAGIKPAEVILPMTVANKPGHRGEHERSRKTIVRGMPGRSGVTVVTTLVCFLLCTRGCGCIGPGIPCALFGGENIHGKTRAHAARSRSCVNVIASESEAIHLPLRLHGLLRFARKDG